VYHDTATEWSDLAWLSNRLAFDPDEQSVPWDAAVAGVAAYAAAPTDTQKNFLDANFANHGLPYGSDTFFIDAGVNIKGRPIYEILTSDWFEDRLRTRVVTVKTAASARGEKILVAPSGQGLILNEILAQFAIGEETRHFAPDASEAAALTITGADKAAQQLRFSGASLFGVSARLFSFSFNFDR
jgi:hypothetical protein